MRPPTTKTVIIWKRKWLPGTETFIRGQQENLRSWTAKSVGLYREPSALAREDDILLGTGGGHLAQMIEEKLLTHFGFLPTVRRCLKAMAPDLVHIHFATNARGIDRICAALNIPFIVTSHGADVTSVADRPGFRGLIYRLHLVRLFRRASLVIAVSEFIAGRLRQLGVPDSKIVVSYIGTDVVDVVQTELAYDVVFVGRLICNKGASCLIEALGLLRREGLSPKVALAGSGPELQELQESARMLGVNVEFLGHVPHNKVSNLIASGKIFCAPSTTVFNSVSEAFGMVFLEAAMQQRPVVSFESGGIPEAVEKGVTGLLVPDGNIEALAEALKTLLMDPTLASKMGHAGRQRVLEHFDRKVCTAYLEELYDQATRSD